MRNAYSPIDRLASELTRPKGTGAEFMTELSKKPGYKQAEVEDRDLQTLTALPKMAREDFLRALKAKRAVVPQERVLGGSSEGLSRAEEYERRMSGEANNDVHHEEWTLPGGKNYREILLKHPNPQNGGFEGLGGHFGDEPDILASIRVKDRTGPNGEKILHLEEIQSDWHQTGREKGYLPKNHQELIDAAYKKSQQAKFAHKRISDDLQESKTWSNVLSQRLNDKDFAEGMPRHAETKEGLRFHNNKIMELMPQVMKADEAKRQAQEEYNRMVSQSGVPDAPYKKNWHELALKRMIQHAAEKGYDSIAITPGEEQAKRYKLSKHVGMVSYNPDEQRFQAFKPNRETVMNEKGVSPERVVELIGKDAATRLMSAPKAGDHHFLEGEDLNVGGEGMKGFYDKMVPKFLNQFGKKYGAQVGQVQIPGDPSQRGDASEALGLAHVNLAGMAPQDIAAFNQKLDAHNAKTLHSFPITPEMREDVTKNGIPLYAKGGSVDEDDVPRETVKAYKLFRVDKKHPGKLFPLFIGKHEPVDMGKWVPAEHIPTKGFAERPGWHAGDLPMATHIGEKSDTSLTAPDRRPRNQVWTEIEMPNDVDWQTEANKRGTNQHGRVVSVKAHITDQVPTGGHYRYKTNPNMTGSWLIGGSMKVNRVLSDKEVKAINRAAKQADLPRHEPFDPKEFGFAEGGSVENDYRGSHQAPGPDYGAPLHDVSQGGMYPKDFYGPMGRRYYANEGWDFDQDAYSKVQRVKDKPNEMVAIHRAIPTSVHTEALTKDSPLKHMIRKGDWVAINKEYAKAHGDKVFGKLNKDYKIASMRVPAKHVWTNADSIHEWGYHPTENKAEGGAVKPAVRGIIKERVTVSPDKDVMMYELMSAKRFTKKVK